MCFFFKYISTSFSHDSHPPRKVALDTWLITLRNVITPYRVIRLASRGLRWLPNVSTVRVFDDGPVTPASWLMILNLESGRSLLLHSSSSSKQQSFYLAFQGTIFQFMQSLLYTVYQTIAGFFHCTAIPPVYEQWCDNWSNRIFFWRKTLSEDIKTVDMWA